MSLIVVGSVAYDGVETPHGKVDRMLGGAATYIALSAAYFTDVKIVAVVGGDFAQEDVDLLASRHIDLAGLERVQDGKTFFWAGVYSADMNDRTTLRTDLNVFADFQPKLPESYRREKYLFLGNIQPALQRSVRGQMNGVRITGGDTMNYWINDFRAELLQTLKQWDFLLINDSEARLLSGEYNLRASAAKIQAMGPGTLVIKRGEYGAILFHGDRHFMVPGYLLEGVFDPTGAGDCFAGGFIGYLAGRGLDLVEGHLDFAELRRAVIYGSVMGSFCCEKFGVDRFRTLTRQEIDARYSEFKDCTDFSAGGVLLCGLLLALWSAAAIYLCYSRGWLLYYGDAECHLDIARRMVDSQTPGYKQVGSVWLPLTHWAMLPLVRRDDLWHNGLAGSIPFAFCFVTGGCFLFAAARRIFQSTPAAITATALCALNPNLLYIQATPMTEGMFFGCLMALLYFTVRFRETQAWWAVIGAALALMFGTLTRYDGWFLIPFVGLYFLWTAKQNRFRVAFVFCLLAGLGPAFWLVHNWILSHDALDFYRGPYSALAIQGKADYPGKHDWIQALRFFGYAVFYCAGPGLALMAVLGMIPAVARRAFWPLLLLLLPGIFYLCSMHSGGTPIFVPMLYSGAYYNVRYGLSVLPLLALATAAIVAGAPPYLRGRIAVMVLVFATVPWFIHPHPQNWMVFQEGNQNYAGHRQLEHAVEDYLRPRYVRGAGIVTSFGATTAIYRELGIPLRETLTGDNGAVFDAAAKESPAFPHQQWAVVIANDWAEKAVKAAGCYTLEQSFTVKDAPEVHVYRRTGGVNGSS